MTGYVYILTIGIPGSISLLVVLIIILVAIPCTYVRRKAIARHKQYSSSEHQDGSLSIQDQSELPTPVNAYEQVHLHSSIEIIHSAESETISNTSWQPQADFDGIYSHIDIQDPKSETQAAEVNDPDDPTYEIIGKQNNKEENQISHDSSRVSQNLLTLNDKANCSVEIQNKPKPNEETIVNKGMYAVVNKKQKIDEDAPPIPPHTVEELYTAVAKPSKVKAADDEKKAVQSVSSHPTSMIEDHYTTVKKDSKDEVENEVVIPPPPLSLHRVEELHTPTAVPEKPKGMSVEDKEKAPPIPPHTVEELYTAVIKKPKVTIEDEEKAPPIPPYTVDDVVLSCTSDDDTK